VQAVASHFNKMVGPSIFAQTPQERDRVIENLGVCGENCHPIRS